MFVVGFFFFKQKTAYEMRISDWSSDVCSSDLDEPDYLGDRRHHPGADRGVHPDGLLPRIDRRHLSPILDDARDLDRSEEHTSELQSLVRISYAVFCLKKKKKSNIKNISNKRQTRTKKHRPILRKTSYKTQ